MVTTESWLSTLGPDLAAFLEWRRLAGYRFRVQERWLHQFDHYCADRSVSKRDLGPAFFEAFVQGRSSESWATRQARTRLLSQWAGYLRDRGTAIEGPVLPRHPVRHRRREPYVYTISELRRLFAVIDTWDPPSHSHTNRTVVDPVLFRLLYGCGLRIMEALRLRCSDVDLEAGLLHIRQGKNQKDRLVPMADSLAARCRVYAGAVHAISAETAYFFPGFHGDGYASSTIYVRFRQYLWSAGISHSGHGPRVHDLRHAYCVHRLAQWVRAGEDLTNLLPYLAVYLGHADFRGTEYYLRLTAELYPDLIDTLVRAHGSIIPINPAAKEILSLDEESNQ